MEDLLGVQPHVAIECTGVERSVQTAVYVRDVEGLVWLRLRPLLLRVRTCHTATESSWEANSDETFSSLLPGHALGGRGGGRGSRLWDGHSSSHQCRHERIRHQRGFPLPQHVTNVWFPLWDDACVCMRAHVCVPGFHLHLCFAAGRWP